MQYVWHLCKVLKRILLKKIIYGIDINYFSVELTRLSLWLKTFIFGTPLSLIEHHIKEGNSLIGSSVEEGQKALSEYYEEEHNQRDLFSKEFRDIFAELKEVSKKLAELKDNTTEDIEKSKKIYEEEIKPKQEKLSSILNLVTYKKLHDSLYKKKNVEKLNIDPVQTLRDIENYIDNNNDFDEVNRVSSKYKFFHYDIEFPESYNSGFDIIIGNPPWDKVELDDKDFFSQYRSNYRTMKNSEKKKAQDNLFKYYKDIKEEYFDMLFYINTILTYYGAYYPLNNCKKDTNLFRLFIEKNINLLSENASLIYLTPSTWSYEDSSINIRKYIFDNLNFKYFYQFENRKKIFNDVDARVKIAVWSLEKSKKINDEVSCFFMELDTERLYKENKEEILYHLSFSRESFKDTYMIPELINKEDISILKKMYNIGKIIDEKYINFYNELNLTMDKDIFLESCKNNEMPLYEGKMINQFNSKFSEPQYFVNEKALKEKLLQKEIHRMIDQVYRSIDSKKNSKENTVCEYLELDNKKELEKYAVYDYRFPRLAFRDVARNKDIRTLISSIIESNIAAGNTLWLSFPKKYYLEDKEIKINEIPFKRLLWCNAVFNSIVMDYITRLYVTMHVNKTYLMRLPLIHADDEMLGTEPYSSICDNAFALSLYNNAGLGSYYNLPSSFEMPSCQKDYDMIQMHNDIAVAKLYSITFDEFQKMIASFKVLNKKNPQYTAKLLDLAKAEL